MGLGYPVPMQIQTIPARRGAAARVAKGQRVKVINTHGAQVVDTWAFSAGDVSEWATRSSRINAGRS